MDKVLHILTPNKNTTRYFGVDFFAQLCTGSNPTYKYYSTTIDFNAVYKNEIVTMPKVILESLKLELSSKSKDSIIGISSNPDIYDATDTIKPVLDILSENDMGLYLETSSRKILDDIEILSEFSKHHPLLIAIDVAGKSNYDNEEIFPENLLLKNSEKILNKLAEAKINYGVIYKPVIPFMNDDIKDFSSAVETIINTGVKFIYPSFVVHFDSSKLKAFYDCVDKHNPGLKNKYMDEFGKKYSWSSDLAKDLKKDFVFMCRKEKVLFSMKDITNLYKPDLNVQLKLF